MRAADLSDADLIADLERRAAHQPWSPRAVASSLATQGTRALLVGEPPSGYVVYNVVADQGEILTLAVTPEARRRGHARTLLDAVLRDWRSRHVESGWLEVRADNEPALALYAAAGWRVTGRRPAYYADGMDAVICRWSP